MSGFFGYHGSCCWTRVLLLGGVSNGGAAGFSGSTSDGPMGAPVGVNNTGVNPTLNLLRGLRRAMDAGVWKGRVYNDMLVTAIVTENTTQRPLRLMNVYATEGLMDQTCQQSPQAGRSRVAWGITGSLDEV